MPPLLVTSKQDSGSRRPLSQASESEPCDRSLVQLSLKAWDFETAEAEELNDERGVDCPDVDGGRRVREC